MADHGLAPLLGIVEVASLAGVSPAMVSRARRAFGVLAPWISRWFFSAVIEGAQEVVAEQGYHTLLHPLGANTAPASASLNDTRSLHKHVDGVLCLNVPLRKYGSTRHRRLRRPGQHGHRQPGHRHPHPG